MFLQLAGIGEAATPPDLRQGVVDAVSSGKPAANDFLELMSKGIPNSAATDRDLVAAKTRLDAEAAEHGFVNEDPALSKQSPDQLTGAYDVLVAKSAAPTVLSSEGNASVRAMNSSPKIERTVSSDDLQGAWVASSRMPTSFEGTPPAGRGYVRSSDANWSGGALRAPLQPTPPSGEDRKPGIARAATSLEGQSLNDTGKPLASTTVVSAGQTGTAQRRPSTSIPIETTSLFPGASANERDATSVAKGVTSNGSGPAATNVVPDFNSEQAVSVRSRRPAGIVGVEPVWSSTAGKAYAPDPDIRPAAHPAASRPDPEIGPTSAQATYEARENLRQPFTDSELAPEVRRGLDISKSQDAAIGRRPGPVTDSVRQSSDTQDNVDRPRTTADLATRKDRVTSNQARASITDSEIDQPESDARKRRADDFIGSHGTQKDQTVPTDGRGTSLVGRMVELPSRVPFANAAPAFRMTSATDRTLGVEVPGVDLGLGLQEPRMAEMRAASDPSMASRTELARPVIAQLSEAIRTQTDGSVEVSLSPEELGRVRITLSGAETGVSVQVMAERPETLDLIRRHIELLAQDLRQQGYDSVSFSFSGNNASASGFEADGSDRPPPEEKNFAPETDRENLPVTEGNAIGRAGDRLDLRL